MARTVGPAPQCARRWTWRGRQRDMPRRRSDRFFSHEVSLRLDPQCSRGRRGSRCAVARVRRRRQRPMGSQLPAGEVSHTGIAVRALGGGGSWATDWARHRRGLRPDLLSGRAGNCRWRSRDCQRRSTRSSFWAIRGAGANFGVVTVVSPPPASAGWRARRVRPPHPRDRAAELDRVLSRGSSGRPVMSSPTSRFRASATRPDGAPVGGQSSRCMPDLDRRGRARPCSLSRKFGAPLADLIQPTAPRHRGAANARRRRARWKPILLEVELR